MPTNYPEVMGCDEAVMYLRSRIGDLAPVAEVLSQWSTPSYRRTHVEHVERRKVPLGVMVDGTKKRGWSRASLDAYADAVIAQVTANDPELAPPRLTDDIGRMSDG